MARLQVPVVAPRLAAPAARSSLLSQTVVAKAAAAAVEAAPEAVAHMRFTRGSPSKVWWLQSRQPRAVAARLGLMPSPCSQQQQLLIPGLQAAQAAGCRAAILHGFTASAWSACLPGLLASIASRGACIRCCRPLVQVRRVLDQIRGRSYEEAIMLLEYMPYKVGCRLLLDRNGDRIDCMKKRLSRIASGETPHSSKMSAAACRLNAACCSSCASLSSLRRNA
jgi:hypothetical protein